MRAFVGVLALSTGLVGTVLATSASAAATPPAIEWLQVSSSTTTATVYLTASTGSSMSFVLTPSGKKCVAVIDEAGDAMCTILGLNHSTSYSGLITVIGTNGLKTTKVVPLETDGPGRPGEPIDPRLVRGKDGYVAHWSPPIEDGASPLLGYVLSYCLTPSCSSPPSTEVVLGPDVLSFAIPGITGLDGIYYVTVSAFNALGRSGAECFVQQASPEYLAEQPEILSSPVAEAGNAQASVSWDPAVAKPGAPVVAYRVSADDWSTYRVTEGVCRTSALSCVVKHLRNGDRYTFWVVAETASTASPKRESNVVVPEGLAAPLDPSAVGGNAQATISWTAAEGPVDGYTVTAEPSGKTCTTTTELTCTIDGLTNGEVYEFSVVAHDGSRSSVPVTTEATPSTVPDAPIHPIAIVTSNGVAVLFDVPFDGGSPITGYTVTSSPGGLTCNPVLSERASAGCIITGLEPGTYTFTVVATNANGDSLPSAISNEVTIEGAPATTPSPTLGIDAHGLNGAARVTWLAAQSTSPITGYTVTAGPGGATCSTSGALTCVVPGLTNGVTYSFTVVAHSTGGDSAPSLPAIATPHGSRLLLKVYFPLDVRTLSAKAKAQIAAFAEGAAANQLTTATVDGFADPTGTAAYNQELSHDRALAVATRLFFAEEKAGLAHLTVIVAGRGVKSTHADNALNRVVEAAAR